MKYWLHRISGYRDPLRLLSWPLLERGFLTIGFKDFSNDAFLNKAMSVRGVGDFDSEFKNADGSLPQYQRNLWRFLRGMSIGDWVLVPGEKVFSVYEIKGKPRTISDIPLENADFKTLVDGKDVTKKNGLLAVDGKCIDLGFYREVAIHRIGDKEAKEVSRYDYADKALTARMKVKNTNVEIPDLGKSLENALNAWSNGRPLRLYSHAIKALLDEIDRLLNPTKFELLVKWYFEHLGATIVPSKNERGKEGDADIVAIFNDLRLTIYIQAKFHEKNSRTDQLAVEQITEYARWAKEENVNDENTVACWVVSTCESFTDDCTRKAKDSGVILINGMEFARMMLEAGLEGLELLEL